MAADSFSVHSSITVWRISFINSMKALSGFLILGILFLGSELGEGTPLWVRAPVDGPPSWAEEKYTWWCGPRPLGWWG